MSLLLPTAATLVHGNTHPPAVSTPARSTLSVGGVLTARTSAEQSSRSNTINMSLSLASAASRILAFVPNRKKGKRHSAKKTRPHATWRTLPRGACWTGRATRSLLRNAVGNKKVLGEVSESAIGMNSGTGYEPYATSSVLLIHLDS